MASKQKPHAVIFVIASRFGQDWATAHACQIRQHQVAQDLPIITLIASETNNIWAQLRKRRGATLIIFDSAILNGDKKKVRARLAALLKRNNIKLMAVFREGEYSPLVNMVALDKLPIHYRSFDEMVPFWVLEFIQDRLV